VPRLADEAVTLAQDGALCQTNAVTIRNIPGQKYDSIISYELGKKPSYRQPDWDDEPLDDDLEPVNAWADEDVPF
jgi:hypothetical protein